MKWVNESTWKQPSTVVMEQPIWQSCAHESRHRDVPDLGAWATDVIKSRTKTWAEHSRNEWKHSKWMSEMKEWQQNRGKQQILCWQISWSGTKTKWRSEVKISKRKYVVTNEKQWWWATSINNIMQWNHNIIIYQCSNWNNWAKLISQNVMWCAITQWSTFAEVNSWPQWSVVLLNIPK